MEVVSVAFGRFFGSKCFTLRCEGCCRKRPVMKREKFENQINIFLKRNGKSFQTISRELNTN